MKNLWQNKRNNQNKRNQRRPNPRKLLSLPKQWRILQRPLPKSLLAIAGKAPAVEKGTYTSHRVDFSKYSVAFFTPHLFVGHGRALSGCGAGALATLTGIPPEMIALRNGRAHYSDHFMRKFLKEHGFTIMPLTLCKVSMAKARLSKWNVLLISQLFKRNEATWGLIFNSMYYHNSEIYNLEALSFLNKPILTAYLLWHPRWQAGFPTKQWAGKMTQNKGRATSSKPFSS